MRGGADHLHSEVASLLGWWALAGVDVAVDDAPRDWLRAPAPPAEPPRSAGSVPAPAAAAAAQLPASLPPSLDSFLAHLAAADLAELGPAHCRVAPAGDPASGLMILVDMPEAGDAEAGMLLSGEVGKLFDRMLAAIGRSRDSVWLAPFSPSRPPAGRIAPAQGGALAALARHHLSLVRPRAVLLLGQAPVQALTGKALVAARQEPARPEAEGPALVASFRPADLIGNAANKARAWRDLRLLINELGE